MVTITEGYSKVVRELPNRQSKKASVHHRIALSTLQELRNQMVPLKTFSWVTRLPRLFRKEQIMPMYLIERYIPGAKELTATELKEIARQSLSVQNEIEAPIQWICSTITANMMVCLFIADDETILRDHARRSGLPIERISEVSAIIGPDMKVIA